MSDRGQCQVAGNAAGTYERVLTPAVFAAWAPLVVALADPRSGERVLDVARPGVQPEFVGRLPGYGGRAGRRGRQDVDRSRGGPAGREAVRGRPAASEGWTAVAGLAYQALESRQLTE